MDLIKFGKCEIMQKNRLKKRNSLIDLIDKNR